jgi:hypothetical protein
MFNLKIIATGCHTTAMKLFVVCPKGACKEPRPFSCIRELIAVQLEEIKEYEIARRGNVSAKSGKIAADDEAHGQEGVLL